MKIQQLTNLLCFSFYFQDRSIEEKPINPTNKQAQASLRVCQMLSNSYQDIYLFRFDEKIGQFFILAGNDIQIVIPSNRQNAIFIAKYFNEIL